MAYCLLAERDVFMRRLADFKELLNQADSRQRFADDLTWFEEVATSQ